MKAKYLIRQSFRLAALIAATVSLVLSWGSAGAQAGTTLAEPPVFASKHGVLDLLLVAEAAPITTLKPFAPTGWVYQFCLRPKSGNVCPAGTPDENLYGGSRLQLEPGDVLKIRLVNRLPPVPDAKHAGEPGDSFLALNPTNIHTHGMLVSPHFPTKENPTYGDNVFVLTLNPANGAPGADAHIHGDMRVGYTDYEIAIPRNHPSGLFWLHPHVHGIALNQVSAGLASIITVGDVSDYVCGDAACSRRIDDLPTRHIILKDTQILADSTLQDQEDPDFCDPAGAPGAPQRQGSCAGQDNSADEDGSDYRGGKWFFTLNGQPYPTIPVGSPKGEIWRITTASGSVSYNLRLWNPAQQHDMVVQVLAIDGVAVQSDQPMSHEDMIEIGGAKMKPVPCPGDMSHMSGSVGAALCVNRLLMMPSSRVEIFVAYRDRNDRLARPEAGASAILRTDGFQTGPTGDSWPAVDLARVEFKGAGPSAGGAEILTVAGQARGLRQPDALAADLKIANTAVGRDPSCKPLAPGHARRIFFNVPADNPDGFGLGYEEIDQKGRPVPGTFLDVTPFDPDKPTICLPLGRNNTPVEERWELVNLAGEDHNFHIHQTKFRVLSKDEIDDAELPARSRGMAILHDNVPLQHADGECDSVDDWRNGVCTAHPVTVEIPFTIAGDFVYHCHILEHEDGGMMARIRVRPAL